MRSRRSGSPRARTTGAPFLRRIESLPDKGDAIPETSDRETKHYLITRDFLNSPQRFLKHLVAAPPGESA